MSKPCARCGRTGSNDIGDRIRHIKRFKDEIVTGRCGKPTGVEFLDEAQLIVEAYTLLLVMNIFTKAGGPWHDAQSPDWPRRTEVVIHKMEEIFL